MAGDTLAVSEEIASYVSEKFEIRREYVLIFSTGVIGEPLPVERVKRAIDDAYRILEPLDLKRASEVISTTDSFPKYDFVKYGNLEVFGFAKGAGMIHPNMATMLAFIFTNADIKPEDISVLTGKIGDITFNSITVDGCTSTNDSFGIISLGDIKTEIGKLEEALTERIAVSQLVKTAVHGCDPNWGRVISAMGTSSYEFDPEKVEIRIGGITLYKGMPLNNRERAKEYMKSNKEIIIEVDLHTGNAEWVYYSSDLTCDYVRLNSEYTT